MHSPVDTIKERLSIHDVIGSYLKVEKAGSNYKAKCPFHNEKTPSFFISPTRQTYYCFGCGAKGDIFSFVQQFEGLDFMGALKALALKAGVELKNENREARGERERLYSAMESALSYFEGELKKTPDALSYLEGRGLKKESILSWRLGFAKNAWQLLKDELTKGGFTESELERAGLIKRGDKGMYDRFRSRIIFPIFDPSGRVIAFSGRIFGENDDSAKYLNSPETPLFSKSKVLYGFDRAKSEIRKKDYSILVEGQMDLLMTHQAGFGNAVASSGTALTKEHLELLKRLSNNLLMVFDGDSAGISATLRGASLALSLGMDVKVAELPKGEDPAEIIKKDIQTWIKSIKESKHIIDFYLRTILDKKLESRKLGKEIGAKLLPFVKLLHSSIEQAHFLRMISETTGIKESALSDEFKKIPMPDMLHMAGESEGEIISSDSHIEGLQTSRNKNFIEERLLSLLFWQRSLPEPTLDPNLLSSKIELIVGKENFEKMLRDSETHKGDLLFEAEVYYGGKEKIGEEADELLIRLEEDWIRSELARTMQELSLAERGKDNEKSLLLLKKCQTLSEQLAKLKKKAPPITN